MINIKKSILLLMFPFVSFGINNKEPNPIQIVHPTNESSIADLKKNNDQTNNKSTSSASIPKVIVSPVIVAPLTTLCCMTAGLIAGIITGILLHIKSKPK